MATPLTLGSDAASLSDAIVAALVLGPLLVAGAFALTPRTTVARVAVVGLALTSIAAITLAMIVFASDAVTPVTGGWPVPLGIALAADGPATALVVMTALVMGGSGLYLRWEDGVSASSPVVWATLFFLWSGLNTLFLTADLFNAYVALEISGLAGVALIALSGTAKAISAQMRYLLIATGASLIYLLGVALAYAVTGRLDGAHQAPETLTAPALTVMLIGLALMTLGLMIKMAAWPVHGWLPPAHAGAIPPVSAILSALVVKAAAILLIRLWTGPFQPVIPEAAAILVGLLGSGAIFWGSIQALRQNHLKPIIAYSTVAQLGYLLVAVPIILGGAGTPLAEEAWSGTLIHAISHGLAKAGLFLAAGTIVIATGSDHLRSLLGASRTLPLAVMAIAVGGVSIMGLPPSAGFLGKWLMLRAAIASDQHIWIIPIIAGGFLAAAYMFRILAYTFRPPFSEDSTLSLRRNRALEGLALTLGLLAIIAGLGGGALTVLTTVAPGWPMGQP